MNTNAVYACRHHETWRPLLSSSLGYLIPRWVRSFGIGLFRAVTARIRTQYERQSSRLAPR